MALVARLLRRKWSAEQISGVLKKLGTLSISHETIYQRIRWDKCAGGNYAILDCASRSPSISPPRTIHGNVPATRT
jgi:IS30 family transposase